ncbi:hypothetical protein [Paenibacillus sp. FSL R10-2734]|uniref:hypothetical protein n=1 Tax=Paenibacillus sp. FSL R10-2734 TaxID=2954691 RepID=UPI0030DB3C57
MVKRGLKRGILQTNPTVIFTNKQKNKPITKEEKIRRARANLIAKINSTQLNSFISRVAYILNHYEETRDSDKKLALLYWETFQNDIYKGLAITPEQYYHLEPQTSITRARAKIQNEFKLFAPSEKTKRYRRKKEDEFREEQIALVPPKPVITVSCDESKEKLALVGSVWSLDSSRFTQLRDLIMAWKTEKGLAPSFEFHFSHSKRQEVDLYKEFIDLLVSQSDSISFKAVVTNTETSSRKIDEIITDLYTMMLLSGLKHELQSGRTELPRLLNVFKDAEAAKDKLYLGVQREHIRQIIKSEYDGQASLEILEGVPSYTSPFVQIADLFTGCLGRKLNVKGANNHKDQIADYFFEQFGIDPEKCTTENSDFISISFL